jgi:hypothetical protein
LAQAKFLREAQWANEVDCRCRHERLGSVWETRGNRTARYRH